MRAAWFYYEDNLTQQEVAKRLRISRFKVGRLLKEAREKKIVHIEVRVPLPDCFAVERRLEKTFGLQEAVVIPSPQQSERLKSALAEAAALYIQKATKDGHLLGFAYASTLYEIPQFLRGRRFRHSRVTPITGGSAGGADEVLYYDFVSSIATSLGAAFVPLYAPGIVDSRDTQQSLLRTPSIRKALECASQCDSCFVGIGPVSKDNNLVRLGLVSGKQMEQFRLGGAAGELLGRFFDALGRPVETEMDDRVIGISLETLKNIPKVVGVAGGDYKVAAISAALHGGHLHVLITDLDAAEAVLARQKARAAG